jgi:hypothetical protein
MNALPPSQARLVIVGATGMVGGYALRYALDHRAIGPVTAIGRRKIGITSGPEDVNAGKPRRKQRVLGLSFVARESQPASSSRVRAAAAQKGKGCSRAGDMENPRERDCVFHGDLAELHIRHRPRVRAQTKDRRVLARERVRECRAVREVWMQNLLQLGVTSIRRSRAKNRT